MAEPGQCLPSILGQWQKGSRCPVVGAVVDHAARSRRWGHGCALVLSMPTVCVCVHTNGVLA